MGSPERCPAAPRWVADIARRQLNTRALTEGQVESLRSHGLAGEAAASIAADPAQVTPAEQMLIEARRAEVLESLAVAATTRKATKLLEGSGIASLALKGSGLASQTTGTWQGRGGVDVDLLVHPNDVVRVHEGFVREGLRRIDGQHEAPNGWFRWAFPELAYVGWPSTIDLHWGLDHPPRMCWLPFDALSARARTFEVDGASLRTLGAIDAWLFTAVHGCRSFWYRWKWLLDAYRQWHAFDETQRREAREAARAAGCARACAITEALVWWCDRDLDEVTPTPPFPPGSGLPLAHAARVLHETRVSEEIQYTLVQAIRRRADQVTLASRPWIALDSLMRASLRVVVKRHLYRLR